MTVIIGFEDLKELHDHITTGYFSGNWKVDSMEITPGEARRRLEMQGSDPNFLDLDEEPSDLAGEIAGDIDVECVGKGATLFDHVRAAQIIDEKILSKLSGKSREELLK